jgi:hypothetical protein
MKPSMVKTVYVRVSPSRVIDFSTLSLPTHRSVKNIYWYVGPKGEVRRNQIERPGANAIS